MKTLYSIFFSLLLTQSFSQKKIDKPEYLFEIGYHIPLANLKSKIDPSPEIGFWYRQSTRNKVKCDLGVSIYIPNNPKEFNYKGRDSIFKVKNKYPSGMFGIRFNKPLDISIGKKTITLEWSSTLGLRFILFEDTENKYYKRITPIHLKDPESSKTNTKAFTCFTLGQGIMIHYINFGLQAQYYFTPYNWFSNHITSNFGNSNVSINLFYKM